MEIVLGKRIKARRIHLGISQETLAQLSGITQTQISRYESNHSEPTASSLSAIANALKTSTDWLLGLTEEHLPIPFTEELSELELQAVNILRSKTPERRAVVVEVMRLI